MKLLKLAIVWVCVVVAVLIEVAITWVAPTEVVEQVLVHKTRVTADIFKADPDMTWLRAHLKHTKAILIVPELLEKAFDIKNYRG